MIETRRKLPVWPLVLIIVFCAPFIIREFVDVWDALVGLWEVLTYKSIVNN